MSASQAPPVRLEAVQLEDVAQELSALALAARNVFATRALEWLRWDAFVGDQLPAPAR
jgi:hypothetical protein